ncbi:MAG: hypothetical protein WAU47_11300, partial [Desulfobaccales bacterium]
QFLVAAGFSLRLHRLESLCHRLTATRYETTAKNLAVILSEAKDLVFTNSYEILRSRRSRRMTFF